MTEGLDNLTQHTRTKATNILPTQQNMAIDTTATNNLSTSKEQDDTFLAVLFIITAVREF